MKSDVMFVVFAKTTGRFFCFNKFFLFNRKRPARLLVHLFFWCFQYAFADGVARVCRLGLLLRAADGDCY